ncbi:flagellar basal body-associated protein FliL [Sphingomonas sp. SCN 67-18]|uniref:flagellar basal body-associated FliL family protein n=1 Tax=uncultured Sphingomonas sp. TaxID=158754 RepID=UPI000A56A427|nr:flagellar basal body-associated FliL family protein [Sphingomonas sp. SCN 67-18]
MSDEPKKKKKGKMGKMLMIGGALVLLIGGGAGAGVYFVRSGMVGGEAKPVDNRPQLVLKGTKPKVEGEGEGGEGGGEASAESAPSEGGEKYESSYFPMEKEFTSNLRDSVHLIQVGLAVSTNYDQRVINHLKAHEIAVRSAVLMTLGETDEEQVFSAEGKTALQKRLVKAINAVLIEKEGFGGVGNVYFTNFIVQ